MTDEQLRRLQRAAVEAAGHDEAKILYLRQPDERPGPARVDPMDQHVREAMVWWREHPGSDHLDAATAVAGLTGELGRARWPEFVATVQAAVEGRIPVPQPQPEAER
jgi:hypothetical protein